MKKNIIKNKGFALGSTLAAWGLSLAAFLGIGNYIGNNELNTNTNFSINENNQIMNNNKDHSFIPDYQDINEIAKGELLDSEHEGLVSMREEEKLARDVYRTLYEKYGLETFKNISYSENRHSLAVKALLDKYEISDPVEDDTTGKFTIPEMQTLYNDLIEKGNVSLVDALKVGATIEDLDIYDLNSWLEKTDNEDIKMVYENLSRGSRNHMRSFVDQLKSRGENYTAQYLSQDEIDKITTSDKEKGSHAGNSNMKKNRGQKQQGNNGGCKGDTACMEERQEQMQQGQGSGREQKQMQQGQGSGHGRGNGMRRNMLK